mgnify:CR=1 FL=1
MIAKTKSIFSRKIKCQNCGSSFYKKVERGKTKYLCSKYNKTGECVRNTISEDFLVELIERRLGRKVNQEAIDKNIQMVMIENVDPILLEIHFYHQESILFSKDFIRF